MNTKVMFSSVKYDWTTPDGLFCALDREFNFTVDAAASNTNAKCDCYWDKQNDGLAQEWKGHTVFCNPPYGREIGKWVRKGYQEGHKPKTTVVMLIPARTDTAWFHEYIHNKAKVRFLRGRLKFGGGRTAPHFRVWLWYGEGHMKTSKLCSALLALWLLTVNAYALSPARPRPLPPLPELDYTESEINMIANVVNGEVGGISGTVTIYYANGETIEAAGQTLRRIHARVVDNQVHSDLFPDTVRRCVALYWSSAYTATGWRTSEQWQRCRTETLMALYGLVDVPDNVLAATCDPYFAERYTGYALWAEVKWDTGWVSGTFYYYAWEG